MLRPAGRERAHGRAFIALFDDDVESAPERLNVRSERAKQCNLCRTEYNSLFFTVCPAPTRPSKGSESNDIRGR